MNLRHRIRELRKERGQILLLAALFMTVFIGLIGLVVDAGFLYAQRRQAQNGADAAALAGAQRLWEGGSSADATSAALSYANDNGYAITQTQVNLLPAGNPTAVEVIVEEQPTSFFIHVILPGAATVRARALADTVDIPAEYGLLILGEGSCGNVRGEGYDQNGNADVIITDGGAMINTECDDALDKGGGSDFITDGGIDVTGGATIGGSGLVEPAPRDYVPWQIGDPLAALEPPTPGAPSADSPGTAASPDTLVINTPGNYTLAAGTYYGGIRINCSNCTITLESGIHIMAGGGFTMAGSPVLRDDGGNGVLLYVTDCNGANDPVPTEPDGPPTCSGDGEAEPFDIRGDGEINLTGLLYCAPFGPPCTSPYENTRITFWQDAAIHDQIRFAGDASGTTGIWYFPGAELVAVGGSTFGTGQLIVDSFTTAGSGPIHIQYQSFVKIVLPLVVLVE